MRDSTGIVYRSHVLAEFTDQYGDKRVIHKTKGSRLSLKRMGSTVPHVLNRLVAERIGLRIRSEREARGLSLAQLCVRAGLASATPKQRMYEIEKGSRREGMRFGTLYAIAIALDISPAELLPSADEIREAAGVTIAPQGESLAIKAD